MGTKYPFDNMSRVLWIPGADGVADISSPETAETATGVDITCDLTADGLSFGFGTNGVNGPTLCTTKDGMTAGRETSSPSLTGYRYLPPETEPLWDLAVWGARGFLLARFGYSYETAFAEGQPVIVAKSTLGGAQPADTGTDTMATFTVPLFFDDWDQKAVIGGAS